MASMPSLSPNTSTKAEDQRPTPPIPPIRRLSNVNLMTVSPETYLTVDGTQLLKNSPTATVSMLPIPTTSAECTTATGFGDNSADGRVIGPSSAKTRSGLATDELFARSLAPSTNPYQALSVLKNDPSFVSSIFFNHDGSTTSKWRCRFPFIRLQQLNMERVKIRNLLLFHG